MPASALIALATAILLWASAFVAIRAALVDFGPIDLAFLRLLIGSLILGCLIVFRRAPLPPATDVPRLVLHGFLGFSCYHALLNWGEKSVTAGSAAFLISAIPLFSMLLAALLLKERLSAHLIAGTVVCAFGVGLISLGEAGGVRFDLGALLILTAALCESLYIVLQKPMLSRYTPLEYVAWTMLAGTLPLLFAAPSAVRALIQASPSSVASLVYLGVFPAAVAYVAWSKALSHAPVTKVVFSQFLLPVITLVVGMVWLRELPGLLALTGGGIILLGVAVSLGRIRTGRIRTGRNRTPAPAKAP